MNETALYICKEGYRFIDGTTTKAITCERPGKWNPVLQDCKGRVFLQLTFDLVH